MTTLGMRLNTVTKALSQYASVDYNSLAVINNNLLAASTSGIFKKDTDAAVTAYFETKHFDFGVDKVKHLRSAYITGQFIGSISVTSVVDGIDSETVSITVESTLKEKTYVVNFSSDHYGRYIGLKIANVSGLDFSVDSISVYVVITTGKWSDTRTQGRIKGSFSLPTLSSTGA